MSHKLLSVTLRSIGSLSAIQSHEDVLEVRLLRVERADVEPGKGLHERVDLTLDGEADDVAAAAELPHPWQVGESLRGRGLGQGRLDPREGAGADRLDPVDELEPALADQRDPV